MSCAQPKAIEIELLTHRRTIAFIMGLLAFIVVPRVDSSPSAAPRDDRNLTMVQVSVPTPDHLQALIDDGYILDRYDGSTVIVFATDEEAARLESDGYDFSVYTEKNDNLVTDKSAKGLGFYHGYDSLTVALTDYATMFPDITRLSSLGKSVEGRELWALLITDNPTVEEEEPEFKYVSTMHGNEFVGVEMLLYLIDLLLNEYGAVGRITDLVDSTAIWIVPLMNPDGRERAVPQRVNAAGFDLNRNFPNRLDVIGTIFDGFPLDTEGRQPETVHVMEWSASNSFVLSANMHTGALVVNYPYDDDGKPSLVDSPAPDDLVFENVSRRYSINNPPMWNSPTFPDGITNGAAWFVILGGMQDWNYRYLGCNEVTLELSNLFIPDESALPQFWEDNRESLLQYIEAVHIGVRGLVTDRDTGLPVYAKVRVDGNDQPIASDGDVGDYYRMLLPGTYTLRYSAPGYVTSTVKDISVIDGPAARIDVDLASGDINGDGKVSATDLQILINAVLGEPCPFNCDFDGGGPSATDLQLLINSILRIE